MAAQPRPCSTAGPTARAQGIAELAAIVEERELTPDHLFTFVYLATSTAIDELAHEGQTGRRRIVAAGVADRPPRRLRSAGRLDH